MNCTHSGRVVLVCATQVDGHHFQRATLLGRSLLAFPASLRPQLFLLAANRAPKAVGLPDLYNRAIDEIEGNVIVVFLHDDVYLHDWNLCFHLTEAVKCWNLVGVVGSSGIRPGQPGWWHDLDSKGRPIRNDQTRRSGSINHFDPTHLRPDVYGACPMQCDLIDGVFLAAELEILRATGLRFDHQFTFHCYDIDFCYSAVRLGLKIGTWPIPITHGSPGVFGDEWISAAKNLQLKWEK